MPADFLAADLSFPTFTAATTTEDKLTGIYNYVYMLAEQLRYSLYNLDTRNFNQAGLEAVTKPVYAAMRDELDNKLEAYVTARGLEVTLETYVDSALSGSLEAYLTSSEFGLALSGVADASGAVTAASISAAINSAGSDIKISADHIDITGDVKFLLPSDLGDGGSTAISGNRITAGTIAAEHIQLGGAMTVNDNNNTMAGYFGYVPSAAGDYGIGVRMEGDIYTYPAAKELLASAGGVRMSAGNNQLFASGGYYDGAMDWHPGYIGISAGNDDSRIELRPCLIQGHEEYVYIYAGSGGGYWKFTNTGIFWYNAATQTLVQKV